MGSTFKIEYIPKSSICQHYYYPRPKHHYLFPRPLNWPWNRFLYFHCPLLPTHQAVGLSYWVSKGSNDIFFPQRNHLGGHLPSPNYILLYLGGHPWVVPWQVMYGKLEIALSKNTLLLWSVELRKEYSSSRCKIQEDFCNRGFLQRIQPISLLKNFCFKINKFQDKSLRWSETPKSTSRRSRNLWGRRSRNYQDKLGTT